MNSVPIGTIISFMGIIAPDEYLICDGTVYNIDEYKELADFFKEEFGSYNNFGGNGTTTFAVPDLRGEFLRGSGTNSHANQGSGANVGEHQDGTEHPFQYKDTNNYMYYHGSNGFNQAKNRDNTFTPTGMINNGRAVFAPTTTDPYADPACHTSRPTNTSVLYCIKYKS